MNAAVERAYLGELLLQSDYAFIAINRMHQCLEELDRIGERIRAGEDTGREWPTPRLFFREAHAFLSNAAAMSRILWPPGSRDKVARARAEERSDHLRTVLSISGDHVLKSRSLRDHLEHLDERLDVWAHETEGRGIVDLNIGPIPAIRIDAIESRDHLRGYDRDRHVYVFRGDEFGIQDLLKGVTEVEGSARSRMHHLEEAAHRAVAEREGS